MKRWLRALAALAIRWNRSLAGRWFVAAFLFVVVVVLFHPLFLVLGGVIGVVTFGVALAGGLLLGRWHGALYGLVTGLLGIALWTREYGFNLTESISGPAVSVLVGFAGGQVRTMLQRIWSQSVALQRANEVLKATRMELLQAERLALFGEVAAGVAHELNQPLAIIGLAAEVAEQGLADGDPALLARHLRKIRDQVQRAGQIIQRLKSSGQGAKDELPREHSLNDLVHGVLAQFEPQFQALGIELNCTLESSLAPIRCRAQEIQQVLIYLLLNARDAVHVTPEKRIRVATWRQNGEVVAEIADSGTGMTEDVRQRIFDPFFTTKEIGKGSGLGLPISYRVVREHGGTIQVESAPDEGTRVLVRLPVAQAAGMASGEITAA